MPRIKTRPQKERYKKAKKELEKARASMEMREDSLHDKIYRFNAAKKSKNFFEEKWKRLAELRIKSIKLGNVKRTKAIEEEMLYMEQNIEGLDARLQTLTEEIKEDMTKKSN